MVLESSGERQPQMLSRPYYAALSSVTAPIGPKIRQVKLVPVETVSRAPLGPDRNYGCDLPSVSCLIAGSVSCWRSSRITLRDEGESIFHNIRAARHLVVLSPRSRRFASAGTAGSPISLSALPTASASRLSADPISMLGLKGLRGSTCVNDGTAFDALS